MPLKLTLSDIARAIALPVTHSRRDTHKVSHDELDEVRVRQLLHTRRATSYPPYVLSVLSAYIRWQGVTRRGRPALEATLHKLEGEFPEFAAEFRAVNKTFGLLCNPSKTTRSSCPCTYHAAAAAAVDAREASTAPPPPYLPAEANVGLSRLLAHRLASEAGVNSSLYAAGRDAEDALSALGVPMANDMDTAQTDTPSRSHWLNSTAQALLRRYVDDNITANTRRSSLSAALDTAVREVPKWAHQVSVTRQIYNLPPYDIERRTRANVRKTYPECTCVKCTAKPVTPHSSRRKRAGATEIETAIETETESQSQSARSIARSISGGSSHSEGSAYTHIAFFDVEDPPPPYSSTA
ncbi:hypothetical protein CcaverHIS641_0311850 [Cutaneotrichosporon cavernicola]|nr:hypothetical protein CcaverHIS641_0311850 [Cutaneotrichosporon cavernicola]